MPKFVIERNMPDLGKLSSSSLQNAAKTSCDVLREMGPSIEWVHSYVTDDKMYCIYIADNEELIREHAKKGGFPADHIRRVHSVIDPVTGE